jgi:hypothetical protein
MMKAQTAVQKTLLEREATGTAVPGVLEGTSFEGGAASGVAAGCGKTVAVKRYPLAGTVRR